MFNRKQVKTEAKQFLQQHQGFFFVLFLPYIIFNIISESINNYATDIKYYTNINKITANLGNMWAVIILTIVATIFLMGGIFTSLNALRNQDDFQNPLRKSISFIDNHGLFWGVVGLSILKYLMIGAVTFIILAVIFASAIIFQSVLFYLALIVLVLPIIMILAYSQAVFIYRDAYIDNHRISAWSALKQSRELMKGYKGTYFILNLSFIGWEILVALTLGIAGIYVIPYYYLSTLKFYLFLKQNQKSSSEEEIKI
jgi:uncharacterized membrane protein